MTNPKPGSVAGACKPSRWVANSFKVYRLWESLDCVRDSLLVTAAKQSPQNTEHLYGACMEPNPVRKVQLQIKEDLGWKVTGSKLCASKDFAQWNPC